MSCVLILLSRHCSLLLLLFRCSGGCRRLAALATLLLLLLLLFVVLLLLLLVVFGLLLLALSLTSTLLGFVGVCGTVTFRGFSSRRLFRCGRSFEVEGEVGLGHVLAEDDRAEDSRARRHLQDQASVSRQVR